MVPSAWPDRIPLPDTLQKNTDRTMQCHRKSCTFILMSLRRTAIDVPHQKNLPQRQNLKISSTCASACKKKADQRTQSGKQSDQLCIFIM